MKSIILAAGYGKRMRPLTNKTHKTLLDINGKTVIQRIIDCLLAVGLSDIVIVTGYLDELLRSHVNTLYPELGVEYIYNERYGETNNIYSIALALQHISMNQDVVLIESDLIFESGILERLINSPHENVALVDQYRIGMDGTVVSIDPVKQTITNVIPPHLQCENFNFHDKYKTLNIYKFSREFCQTVFKKMLVHYANTVNDQCYYELILGVIIYMQAGEVFGEIIGKEDEWAEVDDPNDLQIARFIFEPNSRKEILSRSFGGYWNYNILDYCFIRNMYFPTSAVLSEMKNQLVCLLHNYGSKQSILDQKLATYLLCDAKNITVLNGLSQIYPILQSHLLEKKVAIPDPCFGEYSRIFPNGVRYADKVGFHCDELAEITTGCNAVVFVNPNNPTGSVLPSDWIYQFVEQNSNMLIIVDESFIDFSEQDSIIKQLEQKPLDNCLVLTSLSKSLGIPGIRLGYSYTTNRELNQYIKSRIPVWNLNSVAEYFLEIILKHRDAIKKSFQQTILDRSNFSQSLQNLSQVRQVYPSGANFILICLECDHEELSQMTDRLLLEYKLYVKDVSSRFDDNKGYLRLAVRAPQENQFLVQALEAIAHECLKETLVDKTIAV